MGSDRARISYDERRRYRGVVSQQGRVTLEADQNEDRLIDSELLREETLDIVGPSGTPDDGFAVQAAPGGGLQYDLLISAGTMYVGGERVVLDSDLLYSAQGEWLDHDGDPDWADIGEKPAGRRERVHLYLEEHEVSAVEDTALLEVALGGPDSAARLRLVQRVQRHATDAGDCVGAAAELEQALGDEGLAFDPATLRLTSGATLEVSYDDPGAPGSLCEPETRGGYLGAENQLIRVQTAGTDENGGPTLVWGFDDASFLYRVDVDAALTTLTLASSPVDDFHKPKGGQTVEVLRCAAALETGTDTTVELSADDFVASLTGQIRTLAGDYDSTTRQVVLSAAIDDPGNVYRDPARSPVVFLRVWQGQVSFTPGQPVKLGDTGVSVTLGTTGKQFHVGDYWQLAVRPKTPTVVYPLRYLHAGQPPDGPRMWICPLAVIEWTNGGPTLLEDCRNHFDDLVDLTKRKESGCCDIVIRPSDLRGDTTLNTIIDTFKKKEATICLAPGRYSLKEPLRLGVDHSGLTIEACHGGAVLCVEPGTEPAFRDGIIVLVHADEITLRGLRFELPHAPVVTKRGEQSAAYYMAMLRSFRGSRASNVFVSIGIRPVHCARLTVEDCTFRFRLSTDEDVFGAGIFASSECWGLTVHRNWFIRDEDYLHESRAVRVLVGYLLAPTSKREQPLAALAEYTGTFAPALLNDASFRDNQFHGLSIAALVHADCGAIELEDNTVRLCEFGFLFLSLSAFAYAALAKDVARAPDMASAEHVLSVFEAISEDPVLAIAGVHARTFPTPVEYLARPVQVVNAAADAAAQQQPMNRIVTTATKAFGGQDVGANPVPARQQLSVDRSKAEAQKLSQTTLAQAAFERVALFQPRPERGLGLSLQCSENDVDLRIHGLQTGFALLAWDVERESGSAIALTGNRFRTSGPYPAVALLITERCAVAGNVIENEMPAEGRARGDSLVILPEWNEELDTNEVAVTGNVLHGPPLLPSRNVGWQSPLDQWYVFNAIA